MEKICAFVKFKRFIIDIRIEKSIDLLFNLCQYKSVFFLVGEMVKERLIVLLSKMI